MPGRVLNLTPKQAAERHRSQSKKLRRYMVEAERENLQDVYETAQLLSSGGLSKAEIRETNPYAKSHGAALFDPAIINMDDLDLYEGWDPEGPVVEGNEIHSTLSNRSPESEFILSPGGTRTMFERPILKRIMSICSARIAKRRKDAIRRTLEEP